MLYDLFVGEILNGIHNLDIKYLTEIRLRVGLPIVIEISGKRCYLASYGMTDSLNSAIICDRSTIDRVVSIASNNSIHTINDQLVNGYIVYRGGIRIGVAGEFVYVNDKIKTIKNIQALNIRVPHEVKGCSLRAIDNIVHNGRIYNTLVISPAGAGKTTFIRDLAKQILRLQPKSNVLIVDERCEITGVNNGNVAFADMNCDILSNCAKDYAFSNGIRSLRPDVIVTDELSIADLPAVEYAMTCGVKVIATIHASSLIDLKNKPQICDILDKHLFDRFVLLGSTPGEYNGVYDANFECIAL